MRWGDVPVNEVTRGMMRELPEVDLVGLARVDTGTGHSAFAFHELRRRGWSVEEIIHGRARAVKRTPAAALRLFAAMVLRAAASDLRAMARCLECPPN